MPKSLDGVGQPDYDKPRHGKEKQDVLIILHVVQAHALQDQAHHLRRGMRSRLGRLGRHDGGRKKGMNFKLTRWSRRVWLFSRDFPGPNSAKNCPQGPTLLYLAAMRRLLLIFFFFSFLLLAMTKCVGCKKNFNNQGYPAHKKSCKLYKLALRVGLRTVPVATGSTGKYPYRRGVKWNTRRASMQRCVPIMTRQVTAVTGVIQVWVLVINYMVKVVLSPPNSRLIFEWSNLAPIWHFRRWISLAAAAWHVWK